MKAFRRRHAQALLLVALGLCALAASAGFAFARGSRSPAGTGIVVIDTNLRYQGGRAAGTGMVLTASGEVLTNNHVVTGATSIRVVVPGTKRSYVARVLGYSVQKDVALLQLRGASGLKTVSTSSGKPTVGEQVTAIGNANGTGALTAAAGKVTGLGRSITARDEQGRSEQLNGLIETNAAVEPGDSGGPLLDRSGHVVGMDTAASTGPGFGFSFQTASGHSAYAIPIATALAVSKQIEAGASTATVHVGPTAFLGVEVTAADEGFGASAPGALVAGVVPQGPAGSAGIVPGDLITSVDGRAIATPDDLTAAVLTRKPGARVQVAFTDRGGTARTVTVTLGAGPPQ
jgi:S1-C subfamily serine protease